MIASRRRASYIDHASLALPVELTADCVDVPCSGTQTCVHGACVDSALDCAKPGCTLDASAPPARDAQSDAPPADGGPCPIPASLFANKAPESYWSFDDQGTSSFLDSVTQVTTPVGSATRVPGKCGQGLSAPSALVMNPPYQGMGFGVAFWLFVASPGGTLFSRPATGTAVRLELMAPTLSLSGPSLPAQMLNFPATNATWHYVEISWSSKLVQAAFDGGQPQTVVGASVSLGSNVQLTLGGYSGAVLDEVRTFQVQ